MRGHEVHLALTLAALALVLAHGRGVLRSGRTVVLLLSVAVLGFAGLDLPSIHCITEGFFSSRLAVEFLKLPMVLKLLVAFVPAVFFGRVFCGYVCPKGAAQELLYVRRLGRPVPRGLDRVLRLVPYLSLGLLVAAPLLLDRRLWAELDPFLWLFQAHGHLPGLVLLGLVAPASLFLCRPFCRYLCPMVPVFRLLSRLAPVRRGADRGRCRGCAAGVKACDFGVVSRAPPRGDEPQARAACRFDAAECLQCGRCIDRCPRDAIR
jgi:polyferredoxin